MRALLFVVAALLCGCNVAQMGKAIGRPSRSMTPQVSSAPLTAASTITLFPSANASSNAAARSSARFTLVTPKLLPLRSGFTKQG